METSELDKVSEKIESIEIHDITDAIHECLSPFEKLPREIVFTIFECVPEAICDLRLVSRAVETRVSEFVRNRVVIPLVHEISIYDEYHVYDAAEATVVSNPPGSMKIMLFIPVAKVALFKLRLQTRALELQSNLPDRISRDYPRERGARGIHNICSLTIDATFTSDNSLSEWECLLESMGGRIIRALVNNARGDNELTLQLNLLEQLQFNEMEYNFKLSEFAINQLFYTIVLHNIEHLSMNVSSTPSRALESPHVDFLLELSSVLRSLYLFGQFVPANSNFQWAPHILKMFSRKLDKLHVETSVYSVHGECLTLEGADLLIARLPNMGKRVWFKTNFSQHARGRSCKLNGHVIHLTRHNLPSSEGDKELSIIHKSRLNELSPRDC